ncbi:MAG: hypothetical protein COV91_05275 [Candidatus Taylorbacteria bacterium CG11_big_fil_rev_8_21_14_0_20_46_11]|uniref:Phospholipid/glycerol acyltransferase domain-containing protein n=1 Tax=Candidatus Taylorbacteria bacterium CG11_big_fil_rev_8_21_14_0_20_46_11 TaxID=1975025 RepID=A0A2H0KAD4_9BACT|nr:MAG: hypothetical protein COV91_05275 [Candidatus Taylorbacteria bacterium CG11_big_fil_rev_8_21_14_0_20_46_11]
MNRFFYISPLILQTFIWPMTRPLLRFCLHLDIKGLDRIPSGPEKGRGVIFALNHSSELDPGFVPASLPFLSPYMPMFYTSRENAFYKKSGWRQVLYGGLLFRIWGAHPLQAGKQNYELSLKTHIDILHAGKSLIMFPDGRRLPESDIGTIAHGGIGYLAWKTKALIIPVRIHNVHHMSLTDFLFRRRTVSVIFSTPLDVLGVFKSDVPTVDECKGASRTIMEHIRTLRTD